MKIKTKYIKSAIGFLVSTNTLATFAGIVSRANSDGPFIGGFLGAHLIISIIVLVGFGVTWFMKAFD